MSEFMGGNTGHFVIGFGQGDQIVEYHHIAVGQRKGVRPDRRRAKDQAVGRLIGTRPQYGGDMRLQFVLPRLRQMRGAQEMFVERIQCGFRQGLNHGFGNKRGQHTAGNRQSPKIGGQRH